MTNNYEQQDNILDHVEELLTKHIDGEVERWNWDEAHALIRWTEDEVNRVVSVYVHGQDDFDVSLTGWVDVGNTKVTVRCWTTFQTKHCDWNGLEDQIDKYENVSIVGFENSKIIRQ